MKNRLLIEICLFMSVAVFLSACSYSDIDDAVRHKLNHETVTKINGYDFVIAEDETSFPDVSFEDMTVLDVGDTVDDYQYVNSGELGELESGTKGLSFTLNKVTVYDSVESSNIDYSDFSDKGIFESQDVDSILRNNFILLDMTARLDSEEFEGDYAIAQFNFDAVGWNNSNYDNMGKNNFPPYIVWFSKHPDENDDILDSQHQYYSFIIKPGQTVDFQAGLIAADSFVRDKDVYLRHGGLEKKIDGYTPYCYRLLSDKTIYAEDEATT